MSGDEDISESLISAVREGRLQAVQELISSHGLSYSEAWSQGYTLLRDALENKHTEISKLLLTNGCKVNSETRASVNTPLHSAVKNGDIEIVEMLLDRGADANAENQYGCTPLHHAAQYSTIEIIVLLISIGANVNARTVDGMTPLHNAAEREYLQIVEHLLKHGANVNAACMSKWREGYTPLFLAVYYGNEKMVKLLLEHGANVDAQDKDGKTILHFAVQRGQPVIVEHILKHCPDVNNKSNRNALTVAVYGCRERFSNIVDNLLHYGFTVNPEHVNNSKLLFEAIAKEYLKVLEQLLKYGTDVNKLYRGTTPLHAAVINNQAEMAMLLIRYGADVNAQDESAKVPLFHAIRNIDLKTVEFLLGADVNASGRNGNTALHFISEYEDFINDNDRGKIAKLLLSRGANVNAQTNDGITPFHAAIDRGSVDVVEALLEYNVDVNSKLKENLPPLHLSAKKGNEIITKMLLEHGADLNITNEKNETALHIASFWGPAEVVETLLKYGAQIDSKAACGRTALHFASQSGKKQNVITLLEHGADINITSEYNRTALHIASDRRHAEVVEILLKYGAQIHSKDACGNTALHNASQSGNKQTVITLLEHGADINITHADNETLLHIASYYGHAEVIEVLLKYGAQIDSKDTRGRTALHIASKSGNKQTVITLLEHGADINIISSDNETPLDAAIANNHSFNNRVPEILKNHIIKIKAANLYLNQKNLLSINNNDFQNKCEKEIANMKSEKIGNSIISFYDVLTTSIHQVAIILENENIVQILRSDDYKIKFPLYASMINNQYRKGKRRNELLKQVNKYSYNIFPQIPIELIPKILSYVSDEDLRSLVSACRPADVDEEDYVPLKDRKARVARKCVPLKAAVVVADSQNGIDDVTSCDRAATESPIPTGWVAAVVQQFRALFVSSCQKKHQKHKTRSTCADDRSSTGKWNAKVPGRGLCGRLMERTRNHFNSV